MNRAVLLCALTLTACTDGSDTGDTDTADTDTGVSDGCPDGMHGADNAGMFLSNFRINGLQRFPAFEDAEYLDRPAACIGDDGKSIDYLFLMAGEPYGRVAMDVPRGDESYDLNGNDATIVVDLFGETNAPTFEAPEWVAGSWFVSSVGTTFDSDMAGTALNDDNSSDSLQIQLTVEGSK